jgi:hypothetical protein
MPDGIVWDAGRVCGTVLAGMFCVALERAADEVAGTKTYGESEREDDAAEKDAKSQPNHIAAELEVVEDHGSGKYEHQPFDTERKETRVFKLRINGSNEDRTGQKTRHESASDEQQDSTYDTGKVGQ